MQVIRMVRGRFVAGRLCVGLLLSVGVAGGTVWAGLASPSQAGAADTVIDPGPVGSIAGGAGRLVWLAVLPDGRVALRTLGARGSVRDLPVAPLSPPRRDSPWSMDLDVGTTARGRPIVVYVGCRAGRCWLHRLRLASGARERRRALPRAVPGCQWGAPVIAGGRVFMRLARRVPSPRCRRGVYELTRDGLPRRIREPEPGDYDIDDGRVAYERRRDDGNRVELAMQPLNGGPVTVITHRLAGDFGLGLFPSWDGGRLWLGYFGYGDFASYGQIQLYTLARGRVCVQHDATSLQGALTSTWAFAAGRAFYTHNRYDGTRFTRLLSERTDPPLTLGRRRCLASARR